MYGFIFKHALFPAYETIVKRRGTSQFLAEYEQNQWLTPPQLQQLQLHKLNALLDHCWHTVPFLQIYWRDHGLRPQALQDVSELARFPTLTKSLITEHYQAMISTAWRGKTLSKSTGGSTGDPFKLEYTMESYARRTAIMWRGYAWGGAGIGTRLAYLWGVDGERRGLGRIKDRLYHSTFNRRMFNAFAMHDDNIDAYIAAIARYRPHALVSYVAPVLLVARRLRALGKRIDGLQSILVGAETLYEPERQEIEQAFGCPLFNTYGCREFMLIAAECAEHGGLHINSDHLVVETIDDQGNASGEHAGDVAITDLHNFGMPFVRYRNGDRALLAKNAVCRCGRSLPLMQSIEGRVLDMISTPDGKTIPGEYFVHTMRNWTQVKSYQFVQSAPNELDVLLVAPTALAESERNRLTTELQCGVGNQMRVQLHEVPEIHRSRSGKRRITVAYRAPATSASNRL
jgi:phenylacetate-CoA ligase